jgi:hypothetical protein
MKKILFILFVFSLNFSIAQGNNLQFDHVLTEQLSTGSSQDIIVSANQVLKITALLAADISASAGGNAVITLKKSTSTYPTYLSTTYNPLTKDPIIWLDSGTYTITYSMSGGTNTSLLISGIYFNMVQ